MSNEPTYRGARVLVTGGLGFLGSHLTRSLLEAGARVTIIDALVPGLGGALSHVPESAGLRIIEADVRDEAATSQAIEGSDVIFHLAGASGHVRSMVAPREHLSLDVGGTAVLLAAWAKHAPEARLVLASTRQIYGRARGNLDENHVVVPVDVDGVAKHACEQLLRVYEGTCAGGVALRLTNVYGPRMSLNPESGHVLGAFIRRALHGETLDVFRPGTDRRSFAHAEDVAAAFLLAAQTPECMGRSFNVGGCAPCTIRELADTLGRLAGAPVREVDFPERRRAVDVGDHPIDDTAFRELTGWRPRWELEPGLRATLDALAPETKK